MESGFAGLCRLAAGRAVLSQFKCHMCPGSIEGPLFARPRRAVDTPGPKHGAGSDEMDGGCWDESDEVCYYHSTVLLRLSPLRRAPVMRPCSCRLQKGCNLLQRRPALIDLYDPYPANRGLMRRDLWAKVLGAGGRCASRMRGLSVAFPPRPPAPFHLPPSPIQPVSLTGNTAVKGGSGPVD